MVFDWNAEIRPVLDAVKQAIDSNGYGYAESDEINAVLGRAADDQATDLALSKLRDAGFIDGYRGAEGWSNCTLVEKAYRRWRAGQRGQETTRMACCWRSWRSGSTRLLRRRRSRNGSSSGTASLVRGETSLSTF
jgi:hypothetical protein